MTAEAPSPRQPRRRLTTVREVCQEYLDRALAGKIGPGWTTIRVEVTGFMNAKGDIAIDDLICDDLEKYMEDNPRWRSGYTKKRVAGAIKRAFSFAWNKGLVGAHPLKGVSYAPGKRGEPMSEEQFRFILRNVSAEFRRVLLFLWWTGCRPIELCQLKWEFIDAKRGVAILREHKTAHSRKDGGARIICLPEKAMRLLIWILHDQGAAQDYVFLGFRGQRWRRDMLSCRIRRLRMRLGISATVRLYGCRHSFGTRMAMAGVELKTLSTLMGHTNTRQTEHYIHMAGQVEHLHSALEKALAHKAKTKDSP
jgi:integrase